MQPPGSAGRGNTLKAQIKADAGTAQEPNTCSGALTLARGNNMPEEVGGTGMEAKRKLCT